MKRILSAMLLGMLPFVGISQNLSVISQVNLNVINAHHLPEDFNISENDPLRNQSFLFLDNSEKKFVWNTEVTLDGPQQIVTFTGYINDKDIISISLISTVSRTRSICRIRLNGKLEILAPDQNYTRVRIPMNDAGVKVYEMKLNDIKLAYSEDQNIVYLIYEGKKYVNTGWINRFKRIR